MIKVMNRITWYLSLLDMPVRQLLKSTARQDYFLSQDDECMKAIMVIPHGEGMGSVHTADQSDKALVTKGIDA